MVRLHATLAAALPFALAQSGALENQTSSSPATSPPKYPSPWGEGLGDWADAYEKARGFVSQLTLLEKVNRKCSNGVNACRAQNFY